MSIFLALKALKIGNGDEVLIPNITFVATANAVKLSGAKPVLVRAFAASFQLGKITSSSGSNPCAAIFCAFSKR